MKTGEIGGIPAEPRGEGLSHGGHGERRTEGLGMRGGRVRLAWVVWGPE